jgi:hypothetical protein
VHGQKPVAKWQPGSVHDRSASQSSAVFAFFALKTGFIVFPIMGFTSAPGTYYTFFFPVFPEKGPAT